jgi:lipopolysaccharide export system protein LptC
MRRAGLVALSDGPEEAGGRARQFRTAKRHSRRVRFLRWALPGAAIAGMAIIALYFWFDPLRFYRDLPIDFGRISISDNKLTIEAPKLTGFTQERRPYWVTAEEAAQDLGSPNRIELAGITGQVELSERGETKLRAAKGLYDLKSGNLQLTKGITIDSTGGYKMELRDALMQVRAGRVVTNNPVKATFPEGTLAAKQLEILDHGERVKFTGGVTMTLRIQRGGAAVATQTVEAKK